MTPLRRSFLFSFLDRYVAQVLVVLTTAVMARVLTPAETGLFIMAQAVILLGENFRDFGIGAYIVQEREIGRDMMRTAFTVTMILSLVMGGAVFLGAGAFARFYEQPELEHLLVIGTVGFLIIPFGTPIVAMLRRDLAFRALAGINVAAAIANAAVTVGAGLLGVGAASYMWGYVLSSALVAILAFCLKPQPGLFLPSLAGARRLLSFGSVSMLVSVANMAYDLLPRLVFGKILGADAVGLLSRAVAVCQLPERVIISGLQPVVLPAMAARAREGDDLKESFLHGHMLMSGVQWPALLMVALLADPIVRLLLGPQWTEVPPLVRVIAIANMALAPAFMTYPLLISLGRIGDTLRASLISLPPSALMLMAAAPHGLDAVALGLLVAAPLQMAVALHFICRATGLGWGEFFRASRASLAVSAGTVVIPLLLIASAPHGFDLDWPRTAGAIAGATFGWGIALMASRHSLSKEIRLLFGSLGGALRRGLRAGGTA